MKKNNINVFLYYYRYLIFLIFRVYHLLFKPGKKPVVIDHVSIYIENNKTKLMNTFKITDKLQNIEDSFYNKKVLQELLADENNTLEKTWKTRILFESTPRGNVIMHYNVYKQGFSYYSDSNSIPYNILNAVAMKYVTVFNCRDFFMDNHVLDNEKESPLIKILVDEEVNEEKKEVKKVNDAVKQNGPFAKFKNYQDNSTKNVKKSDDLDKKDYNRNRFINLGKIINFKFTQPVDVRKNKLNGFHSKLLDGVISENKLQKQVMSYSDFKRLNQLTK